MRWCTLLRTALHTSEYQMQTQSITRCSANGTVFSAKALPMGSLLTSQRPAVWPAMLRGDKVDILDNMMVSFNWSF